MKKLFIICALLISAVSITKAQGGGQMGTPEERAERSISRLPATLNLTADQKTKIKAIYLGQTKSFDSLRTAANGDGASMREKMMPMMTATNTKIATVLTAEQKPAFDAYVKEMAERMGGQR
jgi:protein CpxP